MGLESIGFMSGIIMTDDIINYASAEIPMRDSTLLDGVFTSPAKGASCLPMRFFLEFEYKSRLGECIARE